MLHATSHARRHSQLAFAAATATAFVALIGLSAGCGTKPRFTSMQNGNINSTMAGDGIGGLLLRPQLPVQASRSGIIRGPLSWVITE